MQDTIKKKRIKSSLHFFLNKVVKEIRQLYLDIGASVSPENKIQYLAEKANLHVSSIHPLAIAQYFFDCFVVFADNKLSYCMIVYEVIKGNSYISGAIYNKEQSLIKKVGRTCSIWGNEKTIKSNNINLSEDAKTRLDNAFQYLELQLKITIEKRKIFQKQ